MKYKNIVILFVLFTCLYACKKETNHTANNLFKGKVKTITDNTWGQDSLYLFYDSITGNLKDVIIRRINTFFGDSVKYHIFIEHDNNIINFKIYPNSDTIGAHLKITTAGKQITNVSNVNTFDNTEDVSRYIYINNNHVDSMFDISLGTGGYLSDIHITDFMYTNGNCTYYTSKWIQLYDPWGGVYGQAYDTLYFYYNSQNNTQKLLYQQSIERNLNINTFFMFDLLQIDGYYILPHNNNLIDSFTYNNNATVKYFYEFDANNNIIKVNIKYGFGSTAETEREQHMTYY